MLDKKVFFLVAILFLVGCSERPFSCCKENHGSSDPIVINVLDKEFYDDCHIDGSVHVAFDEIESYIADFDKNTELIVYCSNYACGTSLYVAEKLQKLGYTNVAVYEGGTAEWFQHGLPTKGKAQSSYLSHVMVKSGSGEQTSPVSVVTMSELAEKLHVTSTVCSNSVAA